MEAIELKSMDLDNSQQFSMRHDPPPQPKKINEVSIASLEQKFDKLTSLVQQSAVGNMYQIKVCGICSNMGHQTDVSNTSRGHQ